MREKKGARMMMSRIAKGKGLHNGEEGKWIIEGRLGGLSGVGLLEKRAPRRARRCIDCRHSEPTTPNESAPRSSRTPSNNTSKKQQTLAQNPYEQATAAAATAAGGGSPYSSSLERQKRRATAFV